MAHLIDKDAIVAEIKRQILAIDKMPKITDTQISVLSGNKVILTKLLSFLDTLYALEVTNPYEQCIQFASVKDGIEYLADIYSFNIESELFNQLTKEQQELWRKEIEQACIYGGEAGVELARDLRYKENLEVKEVDLKKEIYDAEKRFGDIDEMGGYRILIFDDDFRDILCHFFELGLKAAQKG